MSAYNTNRSTSYSVDLLVDIHSTDCACYNNLLVYKTNLENQPVSTFNWICLLQMTSNFYVTTMPKGFANAILETSSINHLGI